MEKLFISYYRVSTKKQGDSGLGLEAQRAMVNQFIKNNGNRLIGEYVETESGKNDKRPELLKALAVVKATGATLVIAKLDRLSRNLTFISSLMDSKVRFIALDCPDANELTVSIFASLAQWERKRISERTKSALQAKKVREPNWKAGSPVNTLTDAHRAKAMETIHNNSVNNEPANKANNYIRLLISEGYTYAEIAAKLNAGNYRTRLGKEFTISSVFDNIRKFKNLPEQKTV